MHIRPVKTKADHRAALKEIERLMNPTPGTPAGDRLEVLATLVERYESMHHPIEPPDPVDALLYHMESRGLTRRDLEPYLGSRARVAEILNRRRPLTIDMIRKLHAGLDISADVLIRPYTAYVFGTEFGAYQANIQTAWETLRLLAHGIEPRPTRKGAAWNREQLQRIDLHWHDLRHEGACRLLADGVDIRIIQLMLGHASLQQTQRYLNVTDEELRRGLEVSRNNNSRLLRLASGG